MGINWLVALKAVPWTDLAQAAPGIVKGARKLYTTVRGGAGTQASGTEGVDAPAPGRSGLDARVAQIENRLSALMAEQQASAEVIRSLADQNARLIEVVEILRARARILVAACAASCLGCVALAIWMFMR
jgi:hypothetical protein